MLQEPFNSISIVQNSLSNTVLKDGDIVFVRVVEQNPDGSYTASFAGNRFIVRSLVSLSIGSSFKAQLKIENSILKLIPMFEQSSAVSLDHTDISFLSRIGLIPDDISRRIIQFFQQFNIKINVQLAQKARALSSAFPGQEKDAAEIILFLADKEVEATEELVSVILRNARAHPTLNEEDNEYLSYLNHKKSSRHLHWVILPFSDQNSKEDRGAIKNGIKGVVKILINTELKKMEKMIIECDNSLKKFFFVLQSYIVHEAGQRKMLSYCTVPNLSNDKIQFYSEHLKKLLKSEGVEDIRYEQVLAEDGIFCKNLTLRFYEGTV